MKNLRITQRGKDLLVFTGTLVAGLSCWGIYSIR